MATHFFFFFSFSIDLWQAINEWFFASPYRVARNKNYIAIGKCISDRAEPSIKLIRKVEGWMAMVCRIKNAWGGCKKVTGWFCSTIKLSEIWLCIQYTRRKQKAKCHTWRSLPILVDLMLWSLRLQLNWFSEVRRVEIVTKTRST